MSDSLELSGVCGTVSGFYPLLARQAYDIFCFFGGGCAEIVEEIVLMF